MGWVGKVRLPMHGGLGCMRYVQCWGGGYDRRETLGGGGMVQLVLEIPPDGQKVEDAANIEPMIACMEYAFQ
jgi:hypothetical protein